MCGIVGVVAGPRGAQLPQAALAAMTATLRHRGPDAGGHWHEPDGSVAFGHRRLAILDLSAAGHQPMRSRSGRYVICFNGEFYNFGELRRELATVGAQFDGHSDTEVALAAIEHWGVAATLARVRGMFAFGLWDRQERVLVLARDRMGEKPLYYGMVGDSLVFASELKAICQHPQFVATIDRDALALFMRHNYIVAPYTIYRGIYKLTPGSWLQLPATQLPTLAPPTVYWSAAAIAHAGVAGAAQMSDAAWIEHLDQTLRAAVQEQLVADVPLGAFLSGGIDSSTVVALMQAQSARPVRTFTIGFHEAAYNEAHIARQVATHLGTDHTELYVSPQEAMAVIPRLADIYDEPFADSSQIPTVLVAELARSKVTVALSGDGGDELFCGYGRYTHANSLLAPLSWSTALTQLKRWLRGAPRHDADAIYLSLLSHWQPPSAIVPGAVEPPTPLTSAAAALQMGTFTERMMLLDSVSYLPDDILVKVDRAAMAVSLETRVPLLDARVIACAWQVPLALKLRDGSGKWLLRRVLERYLPAHLFERPKMGFGVPIGRWLRGPLRPWAEDLLSASRLGASGLLAVAPIRAKWQDHQAGRANWEYLLWDVLMFQAWYARWIG